MNYRDIFKRWQAVLSERNDSEATEILNNLANDETLLEDCFYKDLSFGTAGLRGILGLGTNRMNIYTVGRATQGFAQYIKANFKNPSVVIAYDSRIMSKEFSELSAGIMAANNIKVYLFDKLSPTPTLSYAIRKLSASAGINITASHNPSEYNGYKAYDCTGCQLSTELAEAVSKEISSVDIFDDVKLMPLEKATENNLLVYLNDSFVDEFVEEVLKLRLSSGDLSELSVVYTPLNGAGKYSVLQLFKKLGIKNVVTVKEQLEPNGNFPTCPYPNPETEKALELGISLLKETKYDVLIATDPDCDRVGIATLKDDGTHKLISGNELGILLIDYIARQRNLLGTMPKNAVAVRSVVSSSLFDLIAESYRISVQKVLTGFKYIGEFINQLEKNGNQDSFIFAFEESCGYLSGSHARDKDAVNGVMLIAEMCVYHKKNGDTLCSALEKIYQKYGYFVDRVYSFEFPGKTGMQSMQNLMADLRKNQPKKLSDIKITAWLDYLSSQRILENGTTEKITLPASDIVVYELGEIGSVIIRPSGTEPKLKVYFSIKEKTMELAEKTYSKLLENIKEIVSRY